VVHTALHRATSAAALAMAAFSKPQGETAPKQTISASLSEKYEKHGKQMETVIRIH